MPPAAVGDLLLLASEGRQEPPLRHRTLLLQVVERAVPAAADRRSASLPGRQGIG
ncbi:hypothetical protein ACGFWI_22535 [Streptomyces sp. NPDC048434]|uniref:hypothetical protein n=1 Tax=Streptomyces sp. NPDC048434 TaxID=3365549 RepID=UPI00371CE59A